MGKCLDIWEKYRSCLQVLESSVPLAAQHSSASMSTTRVRAVLIGNFFPCRSLECVSLSAVQATAGSMNSPSLTEELKANLYATISLPRCPAVDRTAACYGLQLKQHVSRCRLSAMTRGFIVPSTGHGVWVPTPSIECVSKTDSYELCFYKAMQLARSLDCRISEALHFLVLLR